ncbi:MAG: transposase [Desulfatitalea sp.]|nr:transposase [Desulfatitalea sp.]
MPQPSAAPQRNRRSIRLQGYDYSQAGAYFVTICCQNRQCLFGKIVNGEMRLNDAGRIVAGEWLKTAKIRHEIELDEWVVMPNHFHGILVIADGRGTARRARNDGGATMGTARRAPTVEQFGRPVSGSIPTIVRSYKSAVTKRINELRQTPGAKLWQRNYWEHIVRNEPELKSIREYIHNNPAQWKTDKLYGHDAPCPTEIREPITEYDVEAWMV